MRPERDEKLWADESLERVIQSLKPAKPSGNLDRRMARLWAEHRAPAPSVSRFRLWRIAVPAAAAATLLCGLWLMQQRQLRQQRELEPLLRNQPQGAEQAMVASQESLRLG